MQFSQSVYLSKNPLQKVSYLPPKYEPAQLFLTLKIIRCFLSSKLAYYNNLNQHIRMMSEGSCDTEDWSNDAENSALTSQE